MSQLELLRPGTIAEAGFLVLNMVSLVARHLVSQQLWSTVNNFSPQNKVRRLVHGCLRAFKVTLVRLSLTAFTQLGKCFLLLELDMHCHVTKVPTEEMSHVTRWDKWPP